MAKGVFLTKGARNESAVGPLVCRKALFVMLVKMHDATAEEALHGYEQAFSPLDDALSKGM